MYLYNYFKTYNFLKSYNLAKFEQAYYTFSCAMYNITCAIYKLIYILPKTGGSPSNEQRISAAN